MMFFRAISPGGANAINSYYRHVFMAGVSGDGSGWTNITAAQVGAASNNAAGIAAAGGVTNGAAGKTLTTFSFTMTNGTAQADGVLNGSNGVYWTRGTTNYWITFP
jgi:hypothetical protein